MRLLFFCPLPFLCAKARHPRLFPPAASLVSCLPVCAQNDPLGQVLVPPHSASTGRANSSVSDVITNAATIELLVTPHDLSKWRCHYCEPADSKMAENQVTVEVKRR